jgi:hypothetical protein
MTVGEMSESWGFAGAFEGGHTIAREVRDGRHLLEEGLYRHAALAVARSVGRHVIVAQLYGL